jgi:hypothetical protein
MAAVVPVESYLGVLGSLKIQVCRFTEQGGEFKSDLSRIVAAFARPVTTTNPSVNYRVGQESGGSGLPTEGNDFKDVSFNAAGTNGSIVVMIGY